MARQPDVNNISEVSGVEPHEQKKNVNYLCNKISDSSYLPVVLRPFARTCRIKISLSGEAAARTVEPNLRARLPIPPQISKTTGPRSDELMILLYSLSRSTVGRAKRERVESDGREESRR